MLIKYKLYMLLFQNSRLLTEPFHTEIDIVMIIACIIVLLKNQQS